ncbi:Glycosyl hydrolases family 43 [Mariniflexile rhizosphaerae]|uniref:family 43 glycosylhydrolase n=1 Tax=unclassified Mariniflexile TaxID=2643887 RepID=UPI000CAB4060|nr:family 43 glycosylhydrolase [Mariniflexile sp. TRM1-10]AXP79683.1 Glycosyl hydrolases family 43 [Mariniflexile sp. TRM1-10]PLB18976.1 MAG: Glycosyl hydrolase family 43 [Flavobacteriaceae bacterium FS1-H7996/R]
MQIKHLVVITIILTACSVHNKKNYQSVITGIPWYTKDGNNVSAHGANIIKEGDKFYLFGEYKNNDNNRFEGFSCYSSSDLMNWTFESIAMPPNQSGRLSSAECIGERPKVMKCPSTGEFIMYMHADSNNYTNPAVEYAVSNNITGPYEYKGRLMFGDEYIKRWDMGIFQDDDGTGYVILHHGDIYKLANDYKSVVEHVLKHDKTLRTESPAVFKHKDTYYWIGSGLTGWERNDNYYFTAKSLTGPWTNRGAVAPEGTLTWNSQSTFVFPVVGNKTTTFIYMGDRWSFPKQRATATYVWQPLIFNDDEISMPEYHESWTINVETGVWKDVPMKPSYKIAYNDEAVSYKGLWKDAEGDDTKSKRANTKDATASISFKGSQIALRGVASIDCGYGHIIIKSPKGETVHDTWVDMYSNKTVEGLQYMSPMLPEGEYILTYSPTQSHWYWTEKSGKQWGSIDTFISFSEAWVF